MAALLPYLWPNRERSEIWLELRARVVLAMVLLVGAKLANVYVPILYKEAVDILTPQKGGVSTETALIAVPVGLIVAYGLVRILTMAFGELRDAVFAKVAQRSIRMVALRTFRHLHQLALRFHLERKTGGLSRAIERGTKGIEFLLSFMLFNVIPTLLEILLVCGILWYLFNIWFALVTFVSIGGYIVFTMVVTEWRIKYRRAMNRTDEEANTKAVDSLLNYETVKYFGNEAHEARRFDSSLERYEKAAVLSRTSLSLLNIGQAVIISVGLTLIMFMAARGVVAGKMTVGDFVLVNTYMLQLYLPLNFLGFVYREIKQSLADMERMFSLLEVEAEVKDAPDAKPLAVNGGEIRFENVRFSYDQRRRILHDLSFEAAPGTTVAIVGPTGSGKSTISRLLFRFYEAGGGHITIDGQDINQVTQASLRRAIAMPAVLAGCPLGDEVVDRLIEETVGRDGVLPLLQFALTRIWGGMTRGRSAEETLTTLGGVGGALAGEAEALYATLSEAERQIARRAFLAMVNLGEGVQDTRRRVVLERLVAKGESAEQVAAVLDAFAQHDRRLVTLSAEAMGPRTAEVTHEALFAHWEKLQGWLRESREAERFHRRLADAADEWWTRRQQPDAVGLLWSRPPLLNLLETHCEEHAEDLREVDEAFRKTSVDEAGRLADEERQRVEERAAQAERDREVQRQRAEEQARAARRLGRLSAVAAGVAVLAMGAGWFAMQQRGAALDAQAVAEQSETQRTSELFASQLTHAALLAEGEDYAAARRVLDESRALDADIALPRRHGRDFLVRHVETLGGEARQVYEGAGAPLLSTAVSPDGRWLAAVGESGTVVLFELESGTLHQRLDGHERQCERRRLSPRGRVAGDGGRRWAHHPLVGAGGRLARACHHRDQPPRLWRAGPHLDRGQLSLSRPRGGQRRQGYAGPRVDRGITRMWRLALEPGPRPRALVCAHVPPSRGEPSGRTDAVRGTLQSPSPGR